MTEGFGTWQLMAIVMDRWSDPGSSPTVHSALVAQVLLTMVTSGVLSPPVDRWHCGGGMVNCFRLVLHIKDAGEYTLLTSG